MRDEQTRLNRFRRPDYSQECRNHNLTSVPPASSPMVRKIGNPARVRERQIRPRRSEIARRRQAQNWLVTNWRIAILVRVVEIFPVKPATVEATLGEVFRVDQDGKGKPCIRRASIELPNRSVTGFPAERSSTDSRGRVHSLPWPSQGALPPRLRCPNPHLQVPGPILNEEYSWPKPPQPPLPRQLLFSFTAPLPTLPGGPGSSLSCKRKALA